MMRVVALVVAVACTNGERKDYAEEPGVRFGSTGTVETEGVGDKASSSLDAYIEDKLLERLPPVDADVLEVLSVERERRRLAADMDQAAGAVLGPLAVAAVFFVPEGPVDLFLSVFGGDKLGDMYHAGKRAIAARRAKRLGTQHVDEFARYLDDGTTEFLDLARQVSRNDRRALRVIYEHTESRTLVMALLRKRAVEDADVEWIAKKLASGRIDTEFARRFTFDTDLVEDITTYKAAPSWRVLQEVVEGRAVDPGVRNSLASKLAGLLGERAAAERVGEAQFLARYFEHPVATQVKRGVPYGHNGSVDIVAHGHDAKCMMVEVKNWSSVTWMNQGERNKVLKQLTRHNHGIEEIRQGREVAARVLMVTDDGYTYGMARADREDFAAKVRALGWTIELIPSDRIGTFGQLIEDLRR